MRYIDIPVGDGAPEAFNVVVEIPKGSLNKYKYDPKLNLFRLDRALDSPFHYRGEYGFLPSTEAVDGCPLDALVMTETPTFPGCIIEARAIGMFGMIDLGVEDLRLLCVPTRDSRFDWLENFRDLNQHEKRVKVFFVTHLYEFACGLWQNKMGGFLFLRAERQPDGGRTFKLLGGEPLQTSYGVDLYEGIFGAQQC